MSPVPRAVLVVGPAGSGKSTVATAVAQRLGGVHLDKDVACGPLVEALLVALGEDPDARESSQVYLDRVMHLEYRTLFGVAADNLRLGLDVVIDAPFAGRLADPGYLLRMRAATEWPPATAIVVVVRTSPESIRARLVARGQDRDRVKLADWDTFWGAHGHPVCSWVDATVVEVTNEEDAPDLSPLDAIVDPHRR